MPYRGRLILAFLLVPVLLTLLWAVTIWTHPVEAGFWSVRRIAVYSTGILAIGCLSTGMILAARPTQFEDALGGLDKYYRLHKWLGITGTSLGILHWLIEILPRNFVRWGWLAAPVRHRPPRSSTGFDLFRDLHGPAVSVAEPALYAMIALVLIALYKRFPYRFFFKTHRLLAIVYLVLVFHAAILMGPTYWLAPVGPVLGLLMAAATVAALTSLFHRIGKSRRATGAIEDVEYHPDSGVAEVTVRLSTAWPGHSPGQFAYVDFGDREAPHPFTISSAWHQDGRLRFGIKKLGDYTRTLPDRVFPGQAVTIEGPYGRFDLRNGGRQLWIAGGVGIAPFLAGLESLAEEHERAQVDLIYSTRLPDAGLISRLVDLTGQTGVTLHVLVTPPDKLLTLKRLEEMVPDWKTADIWFCGPAGFADALRAPMIAQGLPPGRFHEEFYTTR
ncbi:ferric reductase-like transmembrane domain-containing protein [Sphingomonas sp. 3-13AW]|jgi:predicted ferric reductase|uniref:ferredoxin reductase family protein n=1 Tax=Sphingomonas sp. 3-13AW TaxID=3050450 RepID=UPI003BB607DF